MAIMNKDRPEDRPARPEPGGGWRKLAWFVGLWLGGVIVLTVVATIIRWAIL